MLGTSNALPNGKLAWTLNSASFDKLLAELDTDRNSAGSLYEQLRLRLVRFFDWHGCAFADELADETLDRVARRLAEGELVLNLPSYCFGVARRLLWEVLGQHGLQPALWMPKNHAQNLAEERFYMAARLRSQESRACELQFACLEVCLQQLAPADRELLLQYYETDACTRMDQRAALAARLGISLNTLRVRVYRLREQLKRRFSEQLRHADAARGAVARQPQRSC